MLFIRDAHTKKYKGYTKKYVLVRCECGEDVTILKQYLDKQKTCLKCAVESRRGNTKHGMRRTKEYATWTRIIDRIENKNNEKYGIYGGRGITMCDRWRDSFENFLADMGKMPTSLHSIDRIDVNGNYEPGNCRWATPIEQVRNRRNTKTVTHNGLEVNLAELAYKNNMKYGTLYSRIFVQGLSTEQALSKKMRNHGRNYRASAAT